MEIYYLLPICYSHVGQGKRGEYIVSEGLWLDPKNIDLLYLVHDYEEWLKVYDEIYTGKLHPEYVLNTFGYKDMIEKELRDGKRVS